MIRARLPALAVALALAPAFAASAAEGPLVADLSSKEIAITTGFAGTELLLFGAIEAEGDVVVVVRGPKRREVVRRKTRVAGIWVNGRSMTFDDVPAFYWVAGTRPLREVAGEEVLRDRQIGARRLKFAADGGQAGDVAVFHDALLRNKERAGLYGNGAGRVRIVGGRLFRTTVNFPATVPTGTYAVEVLLLRGGAVVGAETTPLTVRRVGVEAEIFSFAHQRSLAYGIIAISIALAAGWIAGVVFRNA